MIPMNMPNIRRKGPQGLKSVKRLQGTKKNWEHRDGSPRGEHVNWSPRGEHVNWLSSVKQQALKTYTQVTAYGYNKLYLETLYLYIST